MSSYTPPSPHPLPHTPFPTPFADLHSEQHKLLDALILFKASTIVVNQRSLMGVFLDQWSTLQQWEHRPTLVRVQTKQPARGKEPADPWIPAALLTAHDAPKVWAVVW